MQCRLSHSSEPWDGQLKMKLKCPSPLCFSSESDDDCRQSLSQHYDSLKDGTSGAPSSHGGGNDSASGKSISLLKRIGSNLLQNLNYGGPTVADSTQRQFYHAYDHQHQGSAEISEKGHYRPPSSCTIQPYFCKKYEIERKHKIKKRDLVRLYQGKRGYPRT